MNLKVMHKGIPYIVATFVALATILVYLPALQNKFVEWDDNRYIYENLNIRSLNLNFFRWAFFSFYVSNWHPLTWMSHAIDYAIWGLNPMGHHLTSIILHGLNTFLVVILVVYLLRAVSGFERVKGFLSDRRILTTAIITGLLFGLHPLHVESVAWVSERKDVLCAFFFLLSIMSYMSYTTYKTYTNYLLCLGFFILALLSKPMAVTLPAVLLIMDWYPLRRFNGDGRLKPIFIEKIPFFALSLLSAIITILAQGSSIIPLIQIPLSVRVANSFKTLISYLVKMSWPMELIPFYPYPRNIAFLSFEYLLPFMLVIGITTACIAHLRKQRVWMAIWGCYVITLLPVLGIIQVGIQEMADRYTYLPSIGPFLLIGLGVALVLEKLTTSSFNAIKQVILSIVIILIGFISYITVKQIQVWKDGITLWNHEFKIVLKRPHEYYQYLHEAYHNRGAAYLKQGHLDMAIQDFTRALYLGPTLSVYSYISRGVAYVMKGNLEGALRDFGQAISIQPSVYLYNNRGMVYARLGRFEDAIKDYNQAIYINPDSPALYYNRGNAYAKLECLEDALRDYTHAINMSPVPNSDYYYNRGVVYKRLGYHEEAKKDFMQAEELMRKR